MTLLSRHSSFLCLFGVAFLIVSAEVRAQSYDDTKKRSFAELLARRTKAEQADAHKESGTANGHLARVSPLVARVSPLAVNVVGLPPASPTAPSGFGYGRDAFVEGLYPEILGRSAAQSEVDYWARLLVLGLSPEAVADRIWFSPEHRALVASGQAPNIPLKQAYANAYAFGRANRLGPVK